MKIKRENQDMSKWTRLSLFLFFSRGIATHDNDNFGVIMQRVGVSFKDKVDGSAGRQSPLWETFPTHPCTHRHTCTHMHKDTDTHTNTDTQTHTP